MLQKIKIVLLTILGLILINSSNVYATNQKITVNNIKEILLYFNPNGYNESLYTEERLQDFVNEANKTEHGYIKYNKGSQLFMAYNYKTQIRYSSRIEGDTANYIYFSERDNEYKKTRINLGTEEIKYQNYIYCIGGWFTYGTNTIEVKDGWSNKQDVMNFYKQPYFEFSANQIGTTTLENFDGNIPCFYKSSFKTYANSYATFKEIGKLYIDKNYIYDNIYPVNPNVIRKNIEQTSTSEQKKLLRFTDKEIVNGYIVYTMNIEYDYIKTPYIYSIKLESKDKELGQDIYIDFVLLTEAQQGGGIVVESGDTELSGDFTKDETTLGDIQNTIENIFQEPNEEELKKEQEENINQIKDQIQGSLENNKVFNALETAELHLIELLKGKPRGF